MLKSLPHFDAARTGGMPLDPLLFREGMSRVAGAVHVVATAGPAGRAGFTATAVTPVTDSPASLLVCVNAAGRSATSLTRNGVFCVSTLADGDIGVAETFAGRRDLHGQDRFTVGDWLTLATGAPYLATSIVAFDCHLTDARLVATHHVIIGEIVAIHLGQNRPALVYQGRAYHTLDF
jgi:flavin reductase (DIM6/NTAB) family NADH-FMN oxidoreductase RutF